jgi:hypothetical protein
LPADASTLPAVGCHCSRHTGLPWPDSVTAGRVGVVAVERAHAPIAGVGRAQSRAAGRGARGCGTFRDTHPRSRAQSPSARRRGWTKSSPSCRRSPSPAPARGRRRGRAVSPRRARAAASARKKNRTYVVVKRVPRRVVDGGRVPVQARVRARHLRSGRARGGGEESARRTQAANTRRLAWPAANAASRMPPRALPHLADHGHRNDLHGAAAAAHGDGKELRGQEEGRASRARAAGRRCRAARAGARFGASEPAGGCCRRAPCRCSGHSCRRPSSGSAPSPGSAAPASPSLRRRVRALKG